METLEKINNLKYNLSNDEMHRIMGGDDRSMNKCMTATNEPEYACGDTKSVYKFDNCKNTDFEVTEPNECDKDGDGNGGTPQLA